MIVSTVTLFRITVPDKSDEGAKREKVRYAGERERCVYVCEHAGNLRIGAGRGRRARVSDSEADFTG